MAAASWRDLAYSSLCAFTARHRSHGFEISNVRRSGPTPLNRRTGSPGRELIATGRPLAFCSISRGFAKWSNAYPPRSTPLSVTPGGIETNILSNTRPSLAVYSCGCTNLLGKFTRAQRSARRPSCRLSSCAMTAPSIGDAAARKPFPRAADAHPWKPSSNRPDGRTGHDVYKNEKSG